MTKCGIATLLEPYPVGYEFIAAHTPLHLTHVDSLTVAISWQELADKLYYALAEQSAFSVPALTDAFLGPAHDIPVTMLALTPELIRLHDAIMDLLDAEGATLKNPHFHRAGFEPHVSKYGTRSIRAGQQVRITDISIGIKTGDGPSALHRIVATIPLRTAIEQGA